MTDHQTLAAALSAMQAELPKLRKTETAKVTGESKSGGKINYSYGYTGLDQVCEIVLPALGKHGLSVTSKTTFADGNFVLEVALLHEGGEREIGVWPLPDPRRMGPQDIGSAMTYGRRYLTLALTGTFPGGEDDDGAKAQTSARESWSDTRPTNRPVSAPPAPPKPMEFTDEIVVGFQAKLPEGELALAVKGYDWMADKGIHNRSISGHTATEVFALRLADDVLNVDATPELIGEVRSIAEARGLLKTQVSETETLDQVLYEALDLAKHAAAAEESQDSLGS